jgi:putative DNA primase/helicase
MTLRHHPLREPYAKVPDDLKRLQQWVGYRLEPDPKDSTRSCKVPMSSWAPTRRASSANPKTWASFAVALAVLMRTPKWAGIGFMFTSGIVGVDLDACGDVATGRLSDRARDIIGTLNSYAEWSPSGTGVHIFVRGTLPAGGCRRGSVEMYQRGRFFTVTGCLLLGSPRKVRRRQAAIDSVHARYICQSVPARSQGASRSFNVQSTAFADDRELLTAAFHSKHGTRIAALYNGNTDAYDSQSEADLALCAHLAYWTGGDACRIDTLFRQSALFRPKWDADRGAMTYGERTIQRALSSMQTRRQNILSWSNCPPAARTAFDDIAKRTPADWQELL